MRYPQVLFLRHSKYSGVDTIIANAEAKGLLKCSVLITSDVNDVRKLFRTDCNVLVTYGRRKYEYEAVKTFIPERLQSRTMDPRVFVR